MGHVTECDSWVSHAGCAHVQIDAGGNPRQC